MSRIATMGTVLLLGLLLPPVRAEIVDRILAVAGNRILTQSDVAAEANYQALLAASDHPPSPEELARKEVVQPILSRLIDQKLLEQARDSLPILVPENSDTARRLEEIRKRFSDSGAYQKALARLGLAESDLSERLQREASLTNFIERRLRPQVRLDPAEIEKYYENTLAPELRRQGQTAIPPLEDVREKIEQVLTEQEVNRRLEEWLRDLRERMGVKILLPTEPIAPVAEGCSSQ